MNVLIVGAGGFVGKKLASHLRRSHTVNALSRRELDITSSSSVTGTVEELKPELVVNCAVLGVEACESDPAKAVAVNVEGPKNLASAAQSRGAGMVHLSTNYVFDGERENGFYTIEDEPRAINVYGRTKWEGEQAVTDTCERSFIVRTSWVFGGSKANFFDKTIENLRRGESVEAPLDIWASVTYIDDLVQRLDEIIVRGRYGTYHAVNSGVCSKYEFTLEAARILGGDAAMIEPVTSGSRDGVAKRPRFTPMKCILSEQIGLEPLRDWRDALEAFLEDDS